MRVDVLYANVDSEIETAFATMAQNQVEALLIAPDEFFTSHLRQLAAMSLRYRIPASYPISEFAKAGGLVSYGPDFANAYHETGVYTGRVVKGEARRASGGTADQIRICNQPEDRQNARPDHPTTSITACRRGDRIILTNVCF
jgi:hypothetical protein